MTATDKPKKHQDFYIAKGTRIPWSRRGGLKKAAVERWNIEGENVSLKQIMERANQTEYSARLRLKELQSMPGAITWAALSVKRPPGRQKKTTP